MVAGIIFCPLTQFINNSPPSTIFPRIIRVEMVHAALFESRLCNRKMRHRLALILPACLVLYGLSFCLAYFIRFEFSLSDARVAMMLTMLPLVLAIKLISAFCWREFERSFRHVSMGDLAIVGASTLSAACFLWGVNSFGNKSLVPRSVICIDAVFNLVLICSLRAGYRMLFEVARPLWRKSEKQPSLIFGAHQPSIGIMRMLKATSTQDHPYRPIGFVMNGRKTIGTRIGGQPVYSLDQASEDDWLEIQSMTGAKHLLIPGDTPGNVVRGLLPACSAAGIKVNVIPTVGDIVDGKYKLSVRDLQVSDLLRREPNVLDMEAIQSYVTGHRVMVTGGAGSIGSELCRQITALKPEKLIVFDQSEFGTFSIEREFAGQELDGIQIEYVVADVLDEHMLEQVFNEHQPHLVFHAAAYKHVPLMEENPQAAVLNNILGTKAVADAASKHGVDKFVLISTDKAVRPTSVMGASKLMAEKYVQSLSAHSETRFITVRFGNVLDSMGSVVPTFRKQIAAGGPITVTHPEMNRFFMTIPEAVQLVLQAGAIGHTGGVLILDMGEPVKIVDLALDMIMLSGLKFPDDIDITFTGLRPGEKLYEELFYSTEAGAKKVHEKIYCGECPVTPYPAILADIRHLETATGQGRIATLEAFKEIVAAHTDREWTPSKLKEAA